MDFGSILVFLLSLGGFGVQPHAAAPSSAEVLKYAPDDADLMVYLDVEAVLPSNYAVFSKLPNDPNIQQVPELRHMAEQMLQMAEGARAELKEHAGIDVVNDVRSAALWLVVPEKGDPTGVVVIRGKFPGDALAKALGDKAEREVIDGRAVLLDPRDQVACGTAADGSLIMGSAALVRPRVANAWKTKPGRLAARAAGILDEKPWALLVNAPSAAASARLEHEISNPEMAVFRDLATGHVDAWAALFWNGIGWSYGARTAAGYARAVMVSDGLIQLMRASNLGARGLANLGLAVLDSYAGNPDVAKLVQRKGDILKLIESWTGDGNFAAKVDKLHGERRVTARLTGKTFSSVVPITALILPASLGAYWTLARAGAPGPVSQPSQGQP